MWHRYRRVAAYIQALLVMGLPFVRIGGESALRFDLVNLKLHFFGSVLWISEFYLFLAAVIFFLLIAIAFTVVLGRIWCGWLCPQTVLLDIAGDLAGLFSKKPGKYLRHGVLIVTSALVSLTLIWYFVPPAEAMRKLFSSPVLTGFFLVQWAVIYGELGYLGRRFCTTICPYSMLQNALFDSDTLVVRFDRGRLDECMGCDMCARLCPAGIDIKEGLSRKCIACAECIDACASRTAPRNIPSLIGYSGRPFRPKAAALFGLAALAGIMFFMLLYMRPDVELTISRNPEAPVRGINSYTYSLQNNSGGTYDLTFSVSGQSVIIGSRNVHLDPYGRITGGLMVKSGGDERYVEFVLEGGGISLERRAGFL